MKSFIHINQASCVSFFLFCHITAKEIGFENPMNIDKTRFFQ